MPDSSPADPLGPKLRLWLEGFALPLWAERGRDAALGCFQEAVALDGAPLPQVPRRTRVQFRQLFVFSRAALLTGDLAWRQVATEAFAFLSQRLWGQDGQAGWPHVFDAAGRVSDPRRDAYDHAFAVLGLSWYQQATADPAAAALLQETEDFLQAHLRSRFGGYRDAAGSGEEPLRRQNPHMHLIEAFLARAEHSGAQRYRDWAGEIVQLLEERFLDPDSGLLREHFDASWSALSGEGQQHVEPGHMAEWACLLLAYRRLGGEAAAAERAVRLYRLACAMGLESGGAFLVDALDVSGRQIRRSRRFWPQTELLRASLLVGDAAALAQARRTLDALLTDYLAPVLPGAWADRFDAAGRCQDREHSASSFYHLMTALLALWDSPLAGTETSQAAAPMIFAAG